VAAKNRSSSASREAPPRGRPRCATSSCITSRRSASCSSRRTRSTAGSRRRSTRT
jgi:hypothetical protein